jgi:hypothetical protein
MGFSFQDGAERLVLPRYWPAASVQRWPTWPQARSQGMGLF